MVYFNTIYIYLYIEYILVCKFPSFIKTLKHVAQQERIEYVPGQKLVLGLVIEGLPGVT